MALPEDDWAINEIALSIEKIQILLAPAPAPVSPPASPSSRSWEEIFPPFRPSDLAEEGFFFSFFLLFFSITNFFFLELSLVLSPRPRIPSPPRQAARIEVSGLPPLRFLPGKRKYTAARMRAPPPPKRRRNFKK